MKNKTLKFEVYGKPVSKSNSYGLVNRGKFPKMYKTQQTKDWEEKIANAAELAMLNQNWEITDKPLKLTLHVFYETKHRRDLDNSFKAIQDAMNELVFYDDSQIVEISAMKFVKAKKDKVVITLEEVDLLIC